MTFSAKGFGQDLRLAQVNLDELRMPRAGIRADEYTPLSQVPENVGVQPFPGVDMPAQNPHTDLLFLRAQFPFLPILSFPDRTVSLYLAANVAQSLVVPEGSTIGRFSGSGNYYVSRRGNAEVPSATNANADRSFDDRFAASLFKPEFAWFYLGGVKEFSVITPDANCVVQLSIYKTENWPRR